MRRLNLKALISQAVPMMSRLGRACTEHRQEMTMVKGYDTRILTCSKCGEEFVLTVDAQEYMARRGRKGLPRWCRSCFTELKRDARRRGAEPVGEPSADKG
jgi:hypothetical protein